MFERAAFGKYTAFVGFLIILIGLYLISYREEIIIEGFMSVSVYPHRNVGIPITVLGVAILGIGGAIWGSAMLPSGFGETMESFPEIDETEETEDKTPLEILKIRFAKGEISKEEYEEMKKTLES